LKTKKTLRVTGVGQNDPIDVGSLDVSEEVLSQIGDKKSISLLEIGQIDNPNATQISGVTLPPSTANDSQIMSTVLYNNNIQKGTTSAGTSFVNAKEGKVVETKSGVKINSTSVRIHEMFGHGAYIGGITLTKTSNENMVSIQMENLVFTVLAQKTGKNHI
jgi:hypothetical protein